MEKPDKELLKIVNDTHQRYQFIAENSLDYIWILDNNGDHVYVSPAIKLLRGITPEEGLKEKIEDTMTAESYRRLQERIKLRDQKEKSREKKFINKLEIQHICKDGSLVWVESVSKRIYNKQGKPIGFMGISRDINDRKKAELAIKESEEKYRNLIDNSLLGLYIIKDNKIHFCNQMFANIFGFSNPEEVTGIDADKLIHEDSLALVHKKIDQRIKGIKNIAHYNFFGKRKDGKIIQLETLGSKIIVDGEPAIQGSIKDVTEQKVSEDKLRKLSQAIEQSPTSIVITDLKGIIEYVNPYFINLTGYTAEEVIGKSPSILQSSHTSNETYKDLWTTITSGKEWVGELLNKKKSGELYWESVKIAPIKNNKGIITHFVGLKEDISEEKRIQEELILTKEKAIEADTLKTSFLANMSHEIRTPMNAIMGFSSLLSDSTLSDEEREEFIQLINSNSNSLLNLIDDIIDIAKIEAGQLSITNKDFDIINLLSDLFSTYQKINSKLNTNKVKLIWDKKAEDNISIINSDPYRVKQVLSNLVGNAIKYTKEGEINIGYEVLRDIYNNKVIKLQFYVKDTGIGIPPNKLNIIFDRFRQADDSHTRIFGGTGLGLAISKNISKLLGGDIHVVSKEKKGSVFYFTLPYSEEQTKEVKKEKTSGLNHQNIDWSGKTVLIAEDVSSNFYLLETILKRTKINILWVENGEHAVKKTEEDKSIDLILMDIQMPIMNGFEATKIIKKNHKNLPIIAVTAFALAGDKDKIINAGCDDYISKPVKYRDLLFKMNKFIQK